LGDCNEIERARQTACSPGTPARHAALTRRVKRRSCRPAPRHCPSSSRPFTHCFRLGVGQTDRRCDRSACLPLAVAHKGNKPDLGAMGPAETRHGDEARRHWGVIQAVPFEEKIGRRTCSVALRSCAARPAATITASGPLAFSQFRLTRMGASLNIAVSSAAKVPIDSTNGAAALRRCGVLHPPHGAMVFRAKDHCPHVECRNRSRSAFRCGKEEGVTMSKSGSANITRQKRIAAGRHLGCCCSATAAPLAAAHGRGSLLLAPTPTLGAATAGGLARVMAMISSGRRFFPR